MSDGATKRDAANPSLIWASALIGFGVLSLFMVLVALVVLGVSLYFGMPPESAQGDDGSGKHFSVGFIVAMVSGWAIVPLANIGILLICIGGVLRTFQKESARRTSQLAKP